MLQILRAIVAVEVVVVIALLASQGLYAAVDGRRRKRARLVAHARQALLGAVVVERADPDTIDALRRLPANDRDHLLCGVAMSVESRREPLFAELARQVGTAHKIERDLSSRRWWIRRAAVRRLTVLGMIHGRAVSLLADPDPRVRASTAEWLAVVRPDEETAWTLTKMLDDTDQRVRYSVMSSLDVLGSAAEAPLISAAHSSDPEVAAAALKVVAGLRDPVAAASLRSFLHHPDPGIQAEALLAAAPVLGPDDDERICELLADPDVRVRRAAARAVGRAGLRSLIGPLAAHLGDEDGSMREATIAALSELGPGGELVLRRSALAPEVVHG